MNEFAATSDRRYLGSGTLLMSQVWPMEEMVQDKIEDAEDDGKPAVLHDIAPEAVHSAEYGVVFGDDENLVVKGFDSP